MSVVTLVVGVDAAVPVLPERIATVDVLRDALDKFSSLASPMVLAAAVVWSPAA